MVCGEGVGVCRCNVELQRKSNWCFILFDREHYFYKF
jgi:hypothetical protein